MAHGDSTIKILTQSVPYLWLRYPDKYYIYKYSEYRDVARELESDFVPKKVLHQLILLADLSFMMRSATFTIRY